MKLSNFMNSSRQISYPQIFRSLKFMFKKPYLSQYLMDSNRGSKFKLAYVVLIEKLSHIIELCFTFQVMLD